MQICIVFSILYDLFLEIIHRGVGLLGQKGGMILNFLVCIVQFVLIEERPVWTAMCENLYTFSTASFHYTLATASFIFRCFFCSQLLNILLI